MVPAAVLHAMIVVPTQKQPRKDRLNAFLATMVQRRKKVAPNAKPVGREHTAMDAYRVPKVNTAMAVTLLRSLVEIAQPVTTVTTLVKVLVCPAVQVNSTIRRVLSNVNSVLKIPIMVTKAENQVAYPATTVRHRKKAVPNAKSAGRGHMVMDAYRVPKVNIVTAVTLLRSPADIAQLVTTVTTLVKVLVCRVFL